MAYIQSVKGKRPSFGQKCWLAPNATVVGDVTLGDLCSVWFQAVLRGDVNPIRMGNRCNVQDGAVLHCTFNHSSVWMGDDVSIGHNAIIHGCHIENRALVGMGAIIMDKAVIGEGALIAAGSVILSNTKVEGGCLYAGVPAKKIKKVDGDAEQMVRNTAANYLRYATWFQENEE